MTPGQTSKNKSTKRQTTQRTPRPPHDNERFARPDNEGQYRESDDTSGDFARDRQPQANTHTAPERDNSIGK